MNRTRPFTTTILALLISVCCTTTPEVTPLPALTPLEVALQTPSEEMSPAALLEMAFGLLEFEAWEGAAKTFQEALDSGKLNDMGRTVTYWHIADCYEQLGKTEDAAGMYFYFTLVADDILNPINWEHKPVPRDEVFINRFGLQKKLNYAVHYFNTAWELDNAP